MDSLISIVVERESGPTSVENREEKLTTMKMAIHNAEQEVVRMQTMVDALELVVPSHVANIQEKMEDIEFEVLSIPPANLPHTLMGICMLIIQFGLVALLRIGISQTWPRPGEGGRSPHLRITTRWMHGGRS